MGTFASESHEEAYGRSGRTTERTRLCRMAEPATRQPVGDDAPPPFDPIAVDRAYLHERARRRARIERSRDRRRASLRFWVVLLVLVVVSIGLTVTVWREIERLFGL